jgi:hypothetical protein
MAWKWEESKMLHQFQQILQEENVVEKEEDYEILKLFKYNFFDILFY